MDGLSTDEWDIDITHYYILWLICVFTSLVINFMNSGALLWLVQIYLELQYPFDMFFL